MSIKDVQEWLDQQPGKNQPLYAVVVQLDGEGEYQLIWLGQGYMEITNQVPDAAWVAHHIARDIARMAIGGLCHFDGEEYEITRAFIVEKDAEYRVIEEVYADER